MEWNPAPVEEKIGIQFKNSDILRLALIHPSYSEELGEEIPNNERLEFLGNAVINFAIADYLYSHAPYLEVANFSALREKLIEGERLTKLWYQLGMGEAYPFLVITSDRFILRQKFPNPFTQGFKALVGAIHLDRGFSQSRNWLNKKLIAPVLERYLKPIKERSNPNKQLQFLGDSLLKAIVLEYLYRHLPNVRASRLGELSRELTGKECQSEYFKKVDLTDLNLGNDKALVKSFKALVAAMYLQYNASGAKGGFKKTENWFVEQFVDGDEVLRRAIAFLLEDGKSQKWIIRHVMGYESKDYHEGREKYNQLIEGKKS